MYEVTIRNGPEDGALITSSLAGPIHRRNFLDVTRLPILIFTTPGKLNVMHACSRPFLRSFAHGGVLCANSVSIPVFLVPSIISCTPTSVYRSYPQRDRTSLSNCRSLTTDLNRRRTPCTATAQGNSDTFYGQEDHSARSRWLGRTIQLATSSPLQVGRVAVRHHDSCTAGEGREAAAVGWDELGHWAGDGAGKFENYGAGRSPSETREPTASSKVLAALVDHLDVLRVNGYSRHGHSFLRTVDRIIALKGVLGREHSGGGVLSWDQVALHILNAAGPLAETNSRLLERVLSLSPSYEAPMSVLHRQNREPSSHNGVDQDPNHSAIIADLLFRLLGLYARAGNINASIHVWTRLQNLMDSSKLAVVEDFFTRLKSRSSAGDEDEYFRRKHLSYLPHIYYRIPVPILADFLNLITENQEFEFGRWLLYSRDVDGPVIPERIYSNAILAPLLVNFAAATSDVELLSKVISNVSRPFSAAMVRALLRREIGLHRWDSVKDIFASIHSHRKYYWTETELTRLIVVILGIERDLPKALSNADSESLKGAKAILSRLMSGDFGEPKPLKGVEKRFFGANQYMDLLRYMVCTTLPSHADIQHDISDLRKPANTGYLTTATFNVLLRGIVETQGSERGRHFWDLWCRIPERSDSDTDARMPFSRYPVIELSDEQNMSESSPRSLGVVQLGLLNMAGKVQRMKHRGYREDNKGLRPDIGTLRAIIQGALRERARITNNLKYGLSKVKDSPPTQSLERTPNPTAGGNSDSILTWGKEMFRRFGLDEREIDTELGGSSIC
ncbi:MAG: hypothetical protein M1840_001817 [Geoglossum simile]|nr:MAG: hypothetical protein M1840_001817 [Geoglossum simile]